MNKLERLLYITIIFLQFLLIIYLAASTRSHLGEVPDYTGKETRTGTMILHSFSGSAETGNKQWVHFTGYSEYYYLLIPVSKNCVHCRELISEIDAFFGEREENDLLKLILVTEDDFCIEEISVTPLNLLKISHEDMVQFGFRSPSFFCADGRGRVILRQDGYRKGAIAKIYKNLEKLILRKRQSETIKS